MASCSLSGMDDDTLATVIPFPLHRRRPRTPASAPATAPATAPEPPPVTTPAASEAAQAPASQEEYWALVQRLAAQRRHLDRDVGSGAG